MGPHTNFQETDQVILYYKSIIQTLRERAEPNFITIAAQWQGQAINPGTPELSGVELSIPDCFEVSSVEISIHELNLHPET